MSVRGSESRLPQTNLIEKEARIGALMVDINVHDGEIIYGLSVFQLMCSVVEVAKRGKTHLIETIDDVKGHKKLLRTRNNVLVIYAKSSKYFKEDIQVLSISVSFFCLDMHRI